MGTRESIKVVDSNIDSFDNITPANDEIYSVEDSSSAEKLADLKQQIEDINQQVREGRLDTATADLREKNLREKNLREKIYAIESTEKKEKETSQEEVSKVEAEVEVQKEEVVEEGEISEPHTIENETAEGEESVEKELDSVEEIDAEFANRFTLFENLANSFQNNENANGEERLVYEEIRKIIEKGNEVKEKFDSLLHDDVAYEKNIKQKYLKVINSTITLLELKKPDTENGVENDSETSQEEVSKVEVQKEEVVEEGEISEPHAIENETAEGEESVEKGESVRNRYYRVKKEYEEAIDKHYNRGGFSGNVDKIKRFFGIGLNKDLPEDLRNLQLEYQDSKVEYVAKFNNYLKERSERKFDPNNPNKHLFHDKDSGTVRPAASNEKYNEHDPKTKMAFLNKFILKTNQELMEKQEVHLLSDKMRENRDRILITLTKTKGRKVALALGAVAATGMLGGIPALAAITAGMGTRMLTKNSIDKAESKIQILKSNFSINSSLDELERELLSAQMNKRDKVRNQKAISLAAAVAAGWGTSSLAEGADFSGVNETGQGFSDEYVQKASDALSRATEAAKKTLEEVSKLSEGADSVEAVSGDVTFNGNNPYYDSPENNPFEIKSEQLVKNYSNPDIGSNFEDISGVENINQDLLHEPLDLNKEIAMLSDEEIAEIAAEISHEYKVVKNDTLWGIMKREYSEVLVDLSPQEQNKALNELFTKARFDTDLQESLNLRSRTNIDLIYPGETINIGSLGEELKQIVGYEDSVSESSAYAKSSNLEIESHSDGGDVKINFKADNPFTSGLEGDLSPITSEAILENYNPDNFGFSEPEVVESNQNNADIISEEVETEPKVVTPDVYDNVAEAESPEGLQHAVYREVEQVYGFVPYGTEEFNDLIDEVYGSVEEFDLDVLKEAKMIESKTYDTFDKLFGGKKDSPYEVLLKDMTLGEIRAFDNQARATIDQALGSNIKYETYREWIKFADQVREVNTDTSPDTKLGEIFSEMVMNNRLAEITAENTSNKTINV